MPKRKTEEEVIATPEVTEEEVIATPEVTEEAAHTSRKTEVTVVWRNGARVYSKDLHGDTFVELAEEFASKVKGTVV